MKKSIGLFFALIIAFSGYSQVYVNEDFSSFVNPVQPPAGSNWKNIDSLNTPPSDSIWRFDNPGAHPLVAPLSGTVAIVDANYYGFNASQDCYLTTPNINASLANTVVLEFDHYLEAYGNSSAEIQVFNGLTWITDTVFTTSTANPAHEKIYISNYIAGVPNGQVRFRYIGNGGQQWVIDNVRIYQPVPDDAAIASVDSMKTGCNLGSNESITVTVSNLGSTQLSNIPVFYTINGGTPVMETFTGPINPGELLPYTFTQTADFSVFDTFNIKAYTDFRGDPNNVNDTAYGTTIHINTISTFPYSEGFENGNGQWVVNGAISSWEVGTPAGAVINSAANGMNAYVTNLTGDYLNGEESYVISPCFDFTSLNLPLIKMNVWWDIENSWDGAVLQASIDDGVTWGKIGSFGDPNNWYTDNAINALQSIEPSQEGWTGAGASGSGGWVLAENSLAVLANQPSVRFRMVFASDGSVTEEGFGFDDILILDAPSADAGVAQLIRPVSGCNLSNADSVEVKIFNSGSQAISNFPLRFTLNGGMAVTDTFPGTLQPGDTAFFVFDSTINLSAPGDYDLSVFTSLNGDGNPLNDTGRFVVTSIPTVSSFPYYEGFESGTGGWISGGTSNSWQRGTPTGTVINSAANGTNAYVTNLSGNYNNDEESYVQGPCFDFTSLANPQIKMNVWWNSEFSWDGAVLQTSIDNGVTWQIVGAFGDPNNWFTDNSINGLTNLEPSGEGWSGRGASGSAGWVLAENDLSGLAGQPSVAIRIAFGSDGSVNDEGFAFDDITIQDPPVLDVSANKIIRPNSGCALSSTDSVEVCIINKGGSAVSNIPLSFTLNGASAVNDTLRQTVNAGDTAYHTFITSVDLSTPGDYDVVVYSSLAGDASALNDTVRKTVTSIATVTSYPYTEGFENGNGGWITDGVNSSWEIGTPAGAVINSAAAGLNAYITNLTGSYNANEESYVLGPCFDFSSLNAPQVKLNIWYESENSWDGAVLQSSIDNGVTWQKVGAFGDPNNWYTDNSIDGLTGLEPSQEGWTGDGANGSGAWVLAEHELSSLANQPSVQLRVAFGSDGSVQTDGFAFDNILVQDAPSADAGIVDIIRPVDGCGLSAMDSVEISLTNAGSAAISNFDVVYVLDNNSPVTETYTGTINSGDTVNYTFNTAVNLSATQTYNVVAYTSLTGDGNNTNDTTSKMVTNIPVVSNFPYNEGFENGNGGWISGGINSSWAVGAPAATVINSAANGVNAYVTNLTGNYNNGEESFLVSPCFDFTSLAAPQIKLNIWYESENSWDGAVLQASTDAGATWTKVGAFGDPNNWYTDNSVNGLTNLEPSLEGWTGAGNSGSGTWVFAENDIAFLANQSSVLFRFAFGSDGSVNDEGIGIDDIFIGDAPAFDASVSRIVTPSSGCALGNDSIKIMIKNVGSSQLDTIPVSYSVNSGTQVNDTSFVTILPGDSSIFTFNMPFNFSSPLGYDIIASTNLTNDGNPLNDEAQKRVVNVAVVSFPYTEDFELSDGGWTAYGDNSSWSWGSPSGTYIPTASNGFNAWVTNLAGSYNNNEVSYLESPCIDLTGVNMDPTISFLHIFETENNFDEGWMEVSTDGGVTWTKSIDNGSAVNWYNDVTNQWWENTNNSGAGIWDTTSNVLSGVSGMSSVKIRFAFSSDGSTTDEGFGIDLVKIDFPVSVENISSTGLNQLSIYPNPTEGVFNLLIPATNEKLNLEIYDTKGKLVYSDILNGATQRNQIDLNGYAKGVYFVRVNDSKSSVTKKLIVR